MKRVTVYPGAVPLETDLLNTNRNILIALAKFSTALLGTSTIVNGLACTPTGPASLQVYVAPGEIYSLQNLDGTAYSSLTADTTHAVMKQGILLDQLTLNCPAPVTVGQSVNYLIQATYQDVDGGATVLPYYNASNPATAYSGPANSGTAQNTYRDGVCTVSAKAGVAATTGSQTTPAPDAGYIGLFVVTVAYGQTQITAPNIVGVASAPFLPSAGLVVGGLQGNACNISTAGGTADAITGVYSPGITALTNGMTLYVRGLLANATTTPTFTPNSGTIAAKTVVKGAGSALAAGDFAGAGHWAELQYDATLDKWVLLNPATGVTSSNVYKNLPSLTVTVATNALTGTLAPETLDFRSTTLTSGTPVTRTQAAAQSLVVPSGATLGTVSGQSSRLAWGWLDNAGTLEPWVANLSGGVNLDETTLINTTAISGASNSANVIYSTTARTGVAFRVRGFCDISEAAAGTWATAPTLVQGAGGQALAALSSLGYGQTWQSVTRATGTTYYNTTGKPIIAAWQGTYSAGASTVWTVNGVSGIGYLSNALGVPQTNSAQVLIPAGASYSLVVVAGTFTAISAFELR